MMIGFKATTSRLLGLLSVLLATLPSLAETPRMPDLRIAVVGNPIHQTAWTDETLQELKALGFNAVQLNIAWGYRPFDEPLNLADVVTIPGEAEVDGAARRRATLKRRVALARKHGLRTLFNFGSPYANYDPNERKHLQTDAKRLEYKV